ncbi:hypothetical protein Sste5346_009030 [Sporothrix stenoceras]|uniref:BZIP domain-containing protein n=1 Tax=Sporothrix stenoceras TaxID=5173 RepID=A0ABR3YMA6_9PEZI
MSTATGSVTMTSTRPEADAAERKRLRDRVAQQNLRNKRNRHIESLEKQVKLCQELHRFRDDHSNQTDQDNLKTIRDLRAENAALRERQKQLQALFQSFKDVFEPPAEVIAVATTTLADAVTVSQVPDVPEVPTAQETDNSKTLRPIQPSQSLQTNETSADERNPISTPPPPPVQHTAPSPVSSTSTTEVVVSTSVPPYYNYNKTVQDMEGLPDYSTWLAGINATGSSTDGESESDALNHQSHNQNHNLQMDDGNMSGISNQHTGYAMHPPGVPLQATATSLFDTNGQFSATSGVTDMWSNRIPAPMPTSLQATEADLAANYNSTIVAYYPFMYSAKAPAAEETETAAPDNSGLALWAPSGTATSMAGAGTGVEIPVWARIPVRTSGPNDVRRSAWDANMRIIFDSPEVPAPLDIMFGSHQNPLASSLQRSIKTYYHGHPERLAVGWLTYHYIKWRTNPTAERYALLPQFLKPIYEQIWVPHPGSIDLIFWEGLRLKMLKNFDRYDMVKFIRTYTRCLRLRWRWDEDVLVTDALGKHVLRPDYIERFMSAAGWGLKPEFVTYYPELFDGDEWDQIVYNPGPKHLL